ncbi:MAG: hypothetical protein PVF76_13160 [Syntrophobacterales bacterium]
MKGLEMLASIRAVQREEWNPITSAMAVATSVGLILFFIVLMRDEDGFVFLIDHTNLVFHEAGHPIFGLFGETLGLYGGTLGQLVFPVVAVIAFWLRREAISFALATVWFFENFLNIARYMADARARVLPLVGGGEHDWTNIFSRWGVLSYDTRIAGFVSTVGWLGMISMLVWVVWRWHQDRE